MSKRGLKFMRIASAYLGPTLPTGWSEYFEVRTAGKYFGLHNRCPICQEIPMDSEEAAALKKKPHARWRWLAVHMATRHKAVLAKG